MSNETTLSYNKTTTKKDITASAMSKLVSSSIGRQLSILCRRRVQKADVMLPSMVDGSQRCN